MKPAHEGDAPWRALLRSACDCMIVLDGAGRIVELNPAAERMLGHARAQALGRDLAALIIPERLHDRHAEALRRPGDTGVGPVPDRRIETPVMRADGSEFPAELTLADADVGGEPLLTACLRDLSGQGDAQHQLRMRVAQQAAVAEIGQRALANEDLQPLFDRAVRLVAEALDNALCQVLELQPEQDRFLLRAGTGWPDGMIGRATVGTASMAGYTIRCNEAVIVEDLPAETRFGRSELLDARGVTSGMSVTIAGPEGSSWGVLGTHSTLRQRFSGEDAHFLQSVANTLAMAIERQRWEGSLQASEARERARADELSAVMAAVPAVVWIAHDSAATQITGSRASYDFLELPEGSNQSQTPPEGAGPTHFRMHQDGVELQGDELPVQRAARGETVIGCELDARFADGSSKYLFGNATPLHDELGRPRGSVAAFVDITARKRAEEERERLNARLEADRRLMEQILEQMPAGVMAVEAPGGRPLFSNRQLQQITAADDSAGHAGVGRDRPTEPIRIDQQRCLDRALLHGEVVESEEVDLVSSATGTRTISISAAPIRDADGDVVAAVATLHDITRRKRREQTAAFLAEATDALASSLDYERTLEKVAHLAVPRLADWCVVDILEPDDRIRRFAAHGNPANVELAHELVRSAPLALEATRGTGAVLRTGRPEWATDITDDMLVEAACDDEHLQSLRSLGLRSYICMPIKGRGRVLGALTLISAESGRWRVDDDLRLAEELTYRVALAIDNARLYDDARRELADRERVEGELRVLNERLEDRVAERTAELRKRAEQLRVLAAELGEVERRERQRLAQVLHDDLQQLLVAARMRLSAVDGDAAVAEADKLLGQSIKSARSLSGELAPLVLRDLGLGSALEWLARWAHEQYGLRVTVDTDDSAEAENDQLRTLVFQALRELLLNVVKHAGVDEARMMLRRGDGALQLSVIDEGDGFVPDADCDRPAGVGIGLTTIAYRLELMGAEIHIDSRPGAGTRADIRVPQESSPRRQAIAPPNEAQEQRELIEPRPQQLFRVLLVDDHEVLRRGLVQLLEQEPDMQIVGQAASGEEALELAESLRPDAVVMDISLPGISGIETTRRLTDGYPGLRVVGLSIHEEQHVAAAMRNAGAAGYVTKIGASEELIAAIRGTPAPRPEIGSTG